MKALLIICATIFILLRVLKAALPNKRGRAESDPKAADLEAAVGKSPQDAKLWAEWGAALCAQAFERDEAPDSPAWREALERLRTAARLAPDDAEILLCLTQWEVAQAGEAEPSKRPELYSMTWASRLDRVAALAPRDSTGPFFRAGLLQQIADDLAERAEEFESTDEPRHKALLAERETRLWEALDQMSVAERLNHNVDERLRREIELYLDLADEYFDGREKYLVLQAKKRQEKLRSLDLEPSEYEGVVAESLERLRDLSPVTPTRPDPSTTSPGPSLGDLPRRPTATVMRARTTQEPERQRSEPPRLPRSEAARPAPQGDPQHTAPPEKPQTAALPEEPRPAPAPVAPPGTAKAPAAPPDAAPAPAASPVASPAVVSTTSGAPRPGADDTDKHVSAEGAHDGQPVPQPAERPGFKTPDYAVPAYGQPSSAGISDPQTPAGSFPAAGQRSNSGRVPLSYRPISR